MYENDDGVDVVLNKDPWRFRIAIVSSPVIPGTGFKRLNVEIFQGSSPSVHKEKTQDDGGKTSWVVFRPVYDKSPLKKRLCSASDKRYSQTESSTFCKKSLQFPSKAKAGTIRGRSATIYSDYDYDDDDDDALANPLDKVNTPFQRYINKNKEQIRLKENSLWELQDKLKEFNDRLKVVPVQGRR